MKKISGAKKKALAAGAAGMALLCVILVAVCGQGGQSKPEPEEDPVTIQLVYAYQNAQWNQAVQTVVEEFSKARPDIVVDVRVQYENKVYEDILAKLQARGELGDIVQLKTPQRYADAGLLAPISQEVAGLLDEPFRQEGQAYGLLAVGTPNGILYNRGIFQEYGLQEPEDYGQFLAICEALRANQVTPVGVAGGDLWHLEFWVNHFFRNDVLSKSPDWLAQRNEGSVSWQDAELARMLEHLHQLLAGEYVNSDWAVKQDAELAYSMSQGEVAMIYTGAWTAMELEKLNPDISLGWFSVPDEAGNVIVSENMDAYWCLTKECGQDPWKRQAAEDFLSFFYSSEAYARFCQSVSGFPVAVEKGEASWTGIQTEIHRENMRHPSHMSVYVGNEDTPQGFEGALLREVLALGEGRSSPQEAAGRLDILWEQLKEQEARP